MFKDLMLAAIELGAFCKESTERKTGNIVYIYSTKVNSSASHQAHLLI